MSPTHTPSSPRSGGYLLMAGAFLLAATLAGPARAAGSSDETVSVAVHQINRHPATPAEARHVLQRLGEAAMEACGASPFSLPEWKQAVHASPCWHNAMAAAVLQIGDPELADAFNQANAQNG